MRLEQPARRQRDVAVHPTRARIVLLLAASAAAGGFGAGCTGEEPSAEDVRIEWQVTPSPAAVGPATLRFSLVDERRQPVAGAQLRVEGHMTHPGMAPATADVRETSPGNYEAALRFTMPGDWVVVVEGALADGRRLRRQLSVPSVQADR
ncbi:MAG TPA: FixH family protein [Vicinamibacterales bacterium]|nr:FixH family protein [Vicinamibacterales bacterium]